ncbi:MAG: tetratricopeptide repeat protein [Planctomycetota bacterium]
MYSILLSVSLSLLLSVGGFLLDWWHWGWCIPIALILFAVTWILIARSIGKKIQPAMHQVQRQMEQGHAKLALQTLEDMLPMGKWVPMLEGQVRAQMGQLAFHTGDKQRGIELLEKSSLRNGDARLLLASIRHKSGEVDRALSILDLAAKVNRKHPLLYNTYAWMLQKAGRSEEAQVLLAAFVKKNDKHGPSKDNLLRLQNNQRLNMQAFDMHWYSLGLEQPPEAMGQMRRAPKGFREPPKQPKAKQQKKRKRG